VTFLRSFSTITPQTKINITKTQNRKNGLTEDQQQQQQQQQRQKQSK
jgi:hypothetical protein